MLGRLAVLAAEAEAPELEVVEVIGDPMEPTLHHGDRVLIDRSVGHVGDDGLYVVQLAGDGEAMVKRCARDPSTGLLALWSDNRAYPARAGIRDERIRVRGRVLWMAVRIAS